MSLCRRASKRRIAISRPVVIDYCTFNANQYLPPTPLMVTLSRAIKHEVSAGLVVFPITTYQDCSHPVRPHYILTIFNIHLAIRKINKNRHDPASRWFLKLMSTIIISLAFKSLARNQLQKGFTNCKCDVLCPDPR